MVSIKGYFLNLSKIYLLSAALGLHCCGQVFYGCGERGLLSGCSTLASLVAEHGLQGAGFRSWCAGFVALRRVGSPWTRDRTRVPCIGRQILNHWTTREVLLIFLVSPCTYFGNFTQYSQMARARSVV